MYFTAHTWRERLWGGVRFSAWTLCCDWLSVCAHKVFLDQYLLLGLCCVHVGGFLRRGQTCGGEKYILK